MPTDREKPPLTAEEERIKAAFEEEIGYWLPVYDDALRLDPVFFDHYRELVAHTYRDRGGLDRKTKELLLLAINSAVHHLYDDGVKVHLENAFDHGATFEEVREVFQRTSGQGAHAITDGIPILTEVTGRPDTPDEEIRAEQERVKDGFIENRGYWSDFWEDVLRLDHDYLERYTAFSAHAYKHGPLSRKMKEYLAIANAAATTHLYHPGLRAHLENAWELGATRQELLEVIEIVSVIGMQTHFEYASLLIDEARTHGVLPDRLEPDE